MVGALGIAAGLAIPASASAAPAAFTVNDNAAGSGPTGATCGTADFASIQAAINGSEAGDTILVCAGRYDEAVNVNKDLTLLGAQAFNDPRHAPRDRSGARGESVIFANDDNLDGNLDPNEGGVGLNANGITFNGFSVVDSNNPATGSAGIAMSPSFGNYVVDYNIVSDNTIGIRANNATGSSIISQNVISNNNVPGAATGNGIYGDSDVDDLTISDNEFSDQRNAAILLTGAGEARNDRLTISDNTFDGGSGNPGRNELRVRLLFTEDASITGNEFRNMSNNAVHLAGMNTSISVTDNTITGSGFAGVRVAGPGPNRVIGVTGNTLLDNEIGISIASNGLEADELLMASGGNRIFGNNAGIVNDSPGDVDAKGNWFGCNEGPGSPGCDSANVNSSRNLTLVVSAPATIRDGRTRSVRATLMPSPGGAPIPGYTCEFPDGTPITFSTTGGTLSSTTAETQNCRATVSLTAVGSGGATVSASLDNETVTDTVDFTANPN